MLAAGLSGAPVLAQSAGTNDPNRTTTTGTTGTGTTTTSATDRDNRSAMGAERSSQQKLDRSDKNFIEKAAKSGLKEQTLAKLGAERATNPRVRDYAQQLTQDHQQVNQELVRLAQNKGVEFEGELAQLRTAVQGSSMAGHSMSTTGTTGTTATTRTTTTGTTGTTAATTGSPRASDVGSTSAGAGTAGPAGSPQRRQDVATTTGMSDDRDVRRLSDATGRDFDERFVKLMVKEHEDAVKLFEKAAEDSKDREIRSFASQHVSSLREHLQEAKNLERAVAE